MNEPSRLTVIIGHLKDLSAILRDFLLTIILAVCVLNPKSISGFIEDSGLSKLSIFGLSFEVKQSQEKLVAAQQSANAQIVDKTGEHQNDIPIEASNQPVNQELKQAVINAELIAPQILPTAGWVFLGRVNETKTQWSESNSSTIIGSWPITPMQVLTVKDDVYVRGLSNSKWHSSAPIISVAKVGDQLTILDIDYSPAKGGGYFVWAKVSIKANNM